MNRYICKCGKVWRLREQDFPFRCICGQLSNTSDSMISHSKIVGYNAGKYPNNRNPIKNPCKHIGGELRLEECTDCKGKTLVKIFECNLHGECTLIKHLNEIFCCASCKDYKTPARFVTNSDLARDALLLSNLLPHEISGIVGIPRSGMIPATILSTHLHLPLFSLDHRGIHDMQCGWRLSDAIYAARKGPMVVVDDTSMYGGSLKGAKEWWDKYGKGVEVIWTTVYCSPRKYHTKGPLPDLWAVDLDDPHLLEWNFVNSGWARKMAFDFDGVLTREGTTQPLYLPRKYPVELVVTGRFEYERSRTESWMAKHGVVCKRLEMWQGTPAEREDVKAIASFKSEHLKNSGLEFFVESDVVQAEEIAKLIKIKVICPTVARVF